MRQASDGGVYRPVQVYYPPAGFIPPLAEEDDDLGAGDPRVREKRSHATHIHEYHNSYPSLNFGWGGGVGPLIALIFFGFTIYALASTNNASVREACGMNLWLFVLIHLIIDIPLFVLAFCFAACSVALCPGGGAIGGPLLIITAHFVLLILGALYAHHAMSDPACHGALSQASFSKDPILAIVAIVYLVFDGIAAIGVICVVSCVCLAR